MKPKKTKRSTRDRILTRIRDAYPLTTPWILAADLGMTTRTVERHIVTLVKEMMIQTGWDGFNYEITRGGREHLDVMGIR